MINIGQLVKQANNVGVATIHELTEGGLPMPFKVNINLTSPSDHCDIVVARKNLFKIDDLDTIKAINTEGTWDGDNYTLNGVIFYPFYDGSGELTDFGATGEMTAETVFYMKALNMQRGEYKVTPASRYLCVKIGDYTSADGEPLVLETNEDKTIGVKLSANSYPKSIQVYQTQLMITLASEEDTTYEPFDGTVYRYDFPLSFMRGRFEVNDDGWATLLVTMTTPNHWVHLEYEYEETNILSVVGENNIFSNTGDIIYLKCKVSQAETETLYYNAIDNGCKQHARITYIPGNAVFDESDITSDGIQISTLSASEENVIFGTACSSEVTFSLLKSDKTEQVNLQNTFKVEFGFDVDSYDTLWIPFGIFKSKNITYNYTDNVYSVVGYDKMMLFDASITDFKNSVPAAYYNAPQMFEMLCEYISIDYEQFTGYTKAIAGSEYFVDIETCRQLLEKIAETCCTNALITSDGKVKILKNPFTTVAHYEMHNSDCFYLNETSLKKNIVDTTWGDISTYTWGDMNGTYYNELYNAEVEYSFSGMKIVFKDETFLVYPSASVEPSVLQYNNIYEIIDNPIFNAYDTETERGQLEMTMRMSLFPIISRNYRLYYSTDVETNEKFILVEPGDAIVKYLDDNTTHYNLPVYNKILVWNGSFTCKFNTPNSLV